MTQGADIFLVGEKAVAEQLSQGLGREVASQDDPYEALMTLGAGKWDAIILTAGRQDFSGLCRASRRLQRRSRVFALCQPAQEIDVRPLVGDAIDDYFIYPPSADDLAALLGNAPLGRTAAPILAGAANAALPAHDVARLVEASRSMTTLEECIADMVGPLLGAEVQWRPRQSVSSQIDVLLEIGGPSPRVLVAGLHAPREIPPAVRELLSAMQVCLPALAENAARAEGLHRLAITDHLTGAYNRRYFYHLTDQILERSRGRDARVALLLFDVDDFKTYNETFGYAVGDEILRQTAALMRTMFRSHDVVARIGGDEFAVLFWNLEGPRTPDSQPLRTAYHLAERFRKTISRQEFSLLGPQAVGKLTISGGLAMFPQDGQDVRALLRAADGALKIGKRSGKNSIHLIGR